MPPHFTLQEFTARQRVAARALREAGLDAILLFAPESQFWLTGYDTFGFAMFQCLVLDADGRLALLTRLPDLRQARFTSVLTEDQIHVYGDAQGLDPAQDLAALLGRLGLRGGRLGYEGRTPGLTEASGRMLHAALPGLVEASELIPPLRRVKSPAEIALHRRAAELADDALEAGLAETRPGAFEGEIHAAMQGAVLRGGGEPAANETILGSGPGALMCRSYSGRRHLGAQDQLTLEWAGSYHRHHAAMMRTVVLGPVGAQQLRMHKAVEEALEASEAAMRPGRPMAEVYDAHADVLDGHGFADARLKACGYAMGAVFAPIWVDFPMFHAGNPLEMQQNQIFFLHMILLDDTTGLAMTLGHSVLLGAQGPERLSRHGTGLIAC
ncbi:MAG: M24 family metallopeptidase [Paracoccaceae bacterium]